MDCVAKIICGKASVASNNGAGGSEKDKKDISKTVQDTNSRLKNFCSQKNIDFIQNSNIMEEHLGIKKFHLNKKVTLC